NQTIKNNYFLQVCLFTFFLSTGNVLAQNKSQKIYFSGFEWIVRNSTDKQGPGPNYFSSSVVRVDANGWLHLTIRQDSLSGQWICPEITSEKKFGYGDYCFVVEGAIDQYDKNIVLG
ncbi:MAG TPA: hypothetical protein VGH64_11090, partial [Puia sp.]